MPLIVAGPGLQANAVCQDIAQLEDICPTILELIGVPLPHLRFRYFGGRLDDSAPAISGRSLVDLCRGQVPDDWREEAYVESFPCFGPETLGSWARTVCTSRYRYTFYPDGHGEQLFDLDADPHEQKNLVNDPEHTSLRRDLKDRLMEQIIRQDYPVPPRNLFWFGIH